MIFYEPYLRARIDIIKKFSTVFLIGLIIRLVFAPITGHWYDLPIWLDSGEKLANGISPYLSYIHLGQTILWAIWTAISHIISNTFFFSNFFAYIFFIKLLPIFVDMLLPIELLLVINKFFNLNNSIVVDKFIILGIWLNPVFILASAFWGMLDNLAFLLVIVSISLILNNQILVPAILTSLSVALKLYPVIFLPALCLLVLWKRTKIYYAVFYGSLVVFLFIFIAYVPFFIFNWNNQQISGVLGSQLTRAPGGVTPFGIITTLTTSNIPFSLFFTDLFNSIREYFYLNFLWIPSLAIVTIYYIRKGSKSWTPKNIDNSDLFSIVIDISIISFIAWFLSAMWVSEQNFIPLFILILIKIGIKQQKRINYHFYKKLYIQLTILITLFITVNVPIIGFFYLFLSDYNFITNIMILGQVRAIILVTLSIGIIFSVLRYNFHLKYDKIFIRAIFINFSLFFIILLPIIITFIFLNYFQFLESIYLLVLLVSTLILIMIIIYYWRYKLITNRLV